jgi:hypothetical protein
VLAKKRRKCFEAVPNVENMVQRNMTNFDAAQFGQKKQHKLTGYTARLNGTALLLHYFVDKRYT